MSKKTLQYTTTVIVALAAVALLTCRLAVVHQVASFLVGEEGGRATICCDRAAIVELNWHDVVMEIPGVYLAALWVAVAVLFVQRFSYVSTLGVVPGADYMRRIHRQRGGPAVFRVLANLLRQGILHPKIF